MRRSLRGLAAAVLAAGLLVVPAGAQDEDDACRPVLDAQEEPTGEHLCTSQHWFTANDGKAGNVEALTQLEGESSLGYPSWDDTEPDSVTAGAGGGYMGSTVLEVFYSKEPQAGVTFEGELVGNVDSLAFELYMFQPFANAGVVDSHHFLSKVEFDGRPVVNHGSQVEVVSEQGGDAVYRIRYVISGLYGLNANPPGDDKVRSVRVNVTPYFYGQDDVVYVYDAAEAPSNMIVNPTEDQLEGFTVVSRS